MEHKKADTLSRWLFGAVAVICGLYIAGIFWTNLNARTWFNFDLYADAKLAQLISQTGSLFPAEWTFGNQLYVVATPAVAALLYPLVSDPALTLGAASCVMTVLLLLTFLWCIYPFTEKKPLLTGSLCFIGGVLICESASSDFEGMQILFTMGSYYACYLLGILFTVGLWLRLYTNRHARILPVIICLLLNTALGMQSLRQMLCLNLPLCALGLLLVLVESNDRKTRLFSRWNLFSAACFAANIAGILLIHLLKKAQPIRQVDILPSADGTIWQNTSSSLRVLGDFIGLTSYAGTLFSKIAGVLFVAVVAFAVFRILRKRDTSPLACMILFCIISIAAVFAAGILIIHLRAIYFFVWHLTVTVSAVYLMENSHTKMRNLLCFALLIVSTVNLVQQYRKDIAEFPKKTAFYQEISDTLVADGVSHVYYNLWGMNNAARVAAVSNDRVIYCAIKPTPEPREESDLFTRIPYLHTEKWFAPDFNPRAYLCLAGGYLESEDNDPYREYLESHLTLMHRFTDGAEDYCFYAFDETVYRDLIDFTAP